MNKLIRLGKATTETKSIGFCDPGDNPTADNHSPKTSPDCSPSQVCNFYQTLQPGKTNCV